MKFYGQFDPPVDRFIFERYFPDVNIRGTFVEAGAFDGQLECSCRFFEETMGWTGFNLEPVGDIFRALMKNRPNSCNVKVALSDKTEKAVFKTVSHPALPLIGWGSLRQDGDFDRMIEKQGGSIREVEVQTITWTQFVADYKIDVVDLLVLDVEGHEMSVLKGMEGCEVLPHVIAIEFGHVGDAPIRRALSALGYVYDIHSHANAFYVRNDMLPLFAHRRARGSGGPVASAPDPDLTRRLRSAEAALAQAHVEIDRLKARAAKHADLIRQFAPDF